MGIVSDEDLNTLANLIIQKIKENFNNKYMSKNLVNTISIEKTNSGIAVVIPAQTYNMLLFQQKGVVVHTGHGSYANQLNEVGSEFYVYKGYNKKGSKKVKPHNHKGYVDNAIKEAIQEWQGMIQEKYKIGKVTEL